jgi:prepilin-type N-terminal cleavage/methylation domain-containing protein
MRRVRGFTLTELALALLIIGILLGGVVVTLQSQIEARNQAETRRALDVASEALIGFAIQNGRLPCPATDISLGLEVLDDVGTPPGTPAISREEWGNCKWTDGFLPAATLGLTPIDTEGYAIDAWGSNVGGLNRLRYAVDSVTTVSVPHEAGGAGATVIVSAFTGRNALKRSGFAAQPGLVVCASSTGAVAGPPPACGPGVVATRTPAVIYSLGPNGAAAASQSKAAFEVSGASADERENYNTNARVFVSKPAIPSGAEEFDDIVSFLSLNVLYNRLVAANPL